MSKLTERVLCFEQLLLDRLGRFQGVSMDVARYLPHLTNLSNCTYVIREHAETDLRYKQLIPYILIIHHDNVFRYKRGKRGGENRLHALYSVGIGGHIAVDDRLLFSTDAVGYEDSMWRELLEEVNMSSRYREHCVGLINDDSNDVGRHHFAVVHLVEVANPSVVKNHSSITDYGFLPLPEAKESRREYETWSELCLAHIDSFIARARQAWADSDWRN